MKIKDWPRIERPWEKLVTKGAENLKDSELLVILLRTGKAGKNMYGGRKVAAKDNPLHVLCTFY